MSKSVIMIGCGGIYFWWYFGIYKALYEKFNICSADLKSIIGCSTGNMVGSIVLSNPNHTQIISTCEKIYNEITSKPFVITNVLDKLHGFFEEFIDMDQINNRLIIKLNKVTSYIPLKFEPTFITKFENKNDLIEYIFRSTHVPILTQFKLSRGGYFDIINDISYNNLDWNVDYLLSYTNDDTLKIKNSLRIPPWSEIENMIKNGENFILNNKHLVRHFIVNYEKYFQLNSYTIKDYTLKHFLKKDENKNHCIN